MNINLTYDPSTGGAPSAFFTVLNAVVQFFEDTYNDPITINIEVGWGEANGEILPDGALGVAYTDVVTFSYAQVRSALIADATTADDATAISFVPASDPYPSFTWEMARAEAKALGLVGSSGLDGIMGFSTSTAFDYDRSNGITPGTYDLFGVVAHELTHIMGRLFGSGSFMPFELFHYSSPGQLNASGNTAGYFSIDGGSTNLKNFNTNASGDFESWNNSAGADAFRAFAPSGTVLNISEADLKLMDVIGYNRVTASPPPPPVLAKTADFNGDGKGDILWQTEDVRAAIWLMNGTNITGGDLVGPMVPASWHIRASGDFNGDNRADIVWQTDAGQPAVWLIDGLSVLGGDIVGPNPGPTWHIKNATDVNGDSKADIVWQTDSGQAAVWLLNGTQVIGGDIVGPNPGITWHVIGTGDFNADSKSDILWQTDAGQAAIWLMNGTQVLGGDIVGPNPGPTWHVKAAADFDGDGKADILWQTDSGQAAIWLMNGLSVLGGDIVGPNPGASWQIKGAEDLNGDGRSDIVWQTTAGQPAAWLMNGLSVIGGDIIGPNPGPTWHIIAPPGT